MAKQTVTCPSCNARYKTAAAAGRKLKCPKCDTVLVIPAAPTVPDDPLGGLDAMPTMSSDLLDSLNSSDFATPAPAAPTVRPRPQALSASNLAKQRRSGRQSLSAIDPRLTPFLKRLGLGVGALSLLIVFLGAVGWVSEPIGMGAVILGGIAAVGLLFAGHIWFLVIAFEKSVALGIALLFVPFVLPYMLGKRIGASQLAFAVMASSLIPSVVSLGVANVLGAKYSPSSRAGAMAMARSNARQSEQTIETIRQHESTYPPTGEPQEVVFSYMMKINDPSGFLIEGEGGLSQFSGYVKGSLTVDHATRTVSLRHRGTDSLADLYRTFLISKARTILIPQYKPEPATVGAPVLELPGGSIPGVPAPQP